MSLGSDIAAEVKDALIEAATATGDGPLVCTIRKASATGPETPWDATEEGEPTLHEVYAIDSNERIRDASGTLTEETRRTLTIDATGVVPEIADEIAVAVAADEVDANTAFHEITDVRPLAPGGEALLYEVDLAK